VSAVRRNRGGPSIESLKPEVDPRLAAFLQKQGRYYVPAGEFWHRLIGEFMTGLGCQVLSVERLDSHPVWRVRVKWTVETLAHLLVGVPCSHPSAKNLLERQMRVAVSRFLGGYGEKVSIQDVNVTRSGPYLHAAFRWHRGSPGLWTPTRARRDPWRVSLVLRRWLQAQAN
jgi:hypothetical protein